MPRKYTNELLERVEAGELTTDEVLRSLVDFLPEDTVEEFCINGDYAELFEDEEEDEDIEEADDEE